MAAVPLRDAGRPGSTLFPRDCTDTSPSPTSLLSRLLSLSSRLLPGRQQRRDPPQHRSEKPPRQMALGQQQPAIAGMLDQPPGWCPKVALPWIDCDEWLWRGLVLFCSRWSSIGSPSWLVVGQPWFLNFLDGTASSARSRSNGIRSFFCYLSSSPAIRRGLMSTLVLKAEPSELSPLKRRRHPFRQCCTRRTGAWRIVRGRLKP